MKVEIRAAEEKEFAAGGEPSVCRRKTKTTFPEEHPTAANRELIAAEKELIPL